MPDPGSAGAAANHRLDIPALHNTQRAGFVLTLAVRSAHKAARTAVPATAATVMRTSCST
jgi:hypothetical protein